MKRKYIPQLQQVVQVLASVLVPLLMLPSCMFQVETGNYKQNYDQAIIGMTYYRSYFRDANYAEIYDMGSPVFKRTISRADFLSSVRELKRTVGEPINTNLVAAYCIPDQVRFVYHSKFAHADVTEMVIWAVHGDTTQLMGYDLVEGHRDIPSQGQPECVPK